MDKAGIYDRFVIGDLFSIVKISKRTFRIERNMGVGAAV